MCVIYIWIPILPRDACNTILEHNEISECVIGLCGAGCSQLDSTKKIILGGKVVKAHFAYSGRLQWSRRLRKNHDCVLAILRNRKIFPFSWK